MFTFATSTLCHRPESSLVLEGSCGSTRYERNNMVDADGWCVEWSATYHCAHPRTRFLQIRLYPCMSSWPPIHLSFPKFPPLERRIHTVTTYHYPRTPRTPYNGWTTRCKLHLSLTMRSLRIYCISHWHSSVYPHSRHYPVFFLFNATPSLSPWVPHPVTPNTRYRTPGSRPLFSFFLLLVALESTAVIRLWYTFDPDVFHS